MLVLSSTYVLVGCRNGEEVFTIVLDNKTYVGSSVYNGTGIIGELNVGKDLIIWQETYKRRGTNGFADDGTIGQKVNIADKSFHNRRTLITELAPSKFIIDPKSDSIYMETCDAESKLNGYNKYWIIHQNGLKEDVTAKIWGENKIPCTSSAHFDNIGDLIAVSEQGIVSSDLQGSIKVLVNLNDVKKIQPKNHAHLGPTVFGTDSNGETIYWGFYLTFPKTARDIFRFHFPNPTTKFWSETDPDFGDFLVVRDLATSPSGQLFASVQFVSNTRDGSVVSNGIVQIKSPETVEIILRGLKDAYFSSISFDETGQLWGILDKVSSPNSRLVRFDISQD